MPSTYTTNLKFELPAAGATAWGTTVNENITALIDEAIAGYATQGVTDGIDTTITIPNGATGTARNMYLELTGALTGETNLVVPTNKKLYFVYNNTTGGQAVRVKVSGQTGVLVPNGKKTILVCNGADVTDAVTYLGAFTLTNLDNTPIGATTPSTGAFTYAAVTGATPPTNGIYLSAANTLAFASSNTRRGAVNATGNWVLDAASSGVTLYVNAVTGTHSTQIEDAGGAAHNAGYLNVPQNEQSVNYTLGLADAGKFIHHNAGAGSGDTYTIPANATVAFPTGTVVTFTNLAPQTCAIACADTMYLAGTGTTGSRTLAQYGLATAIKLESTKWMISGSGLT